MTDQTTLDQIGVLLAQKATATPDQARRIRRQLRALGYRISDQPRDPKAAPVIAEGDRIAKGEGKPRRERKLPPMPELVTGKRLTSTPVMPEDRIAELATFLESSCQLDRRSVASLSDADYGYGYDLIGQLTPEVILEKFKARWEGDPKWFTVLGEPGTIRILLIGPVPFGLATEMKPESRKPAA